MQERILEAWEQFPEELKNLDRDYANRKVDQAYVSRLLFRGHSDSAWRLQTTLDRAGNEPYSFVSYYRKVRNIQPRLEILSGCKWETLTVADYREWVENWCPHQVYEYPVLQYLAYLRHHGFPSPLLDWTRSPYVAAFFAFRDLVNGATHAAIYVYLEWANSGRLDSSGPTIRGINGYGAHKRHFMQQSEYTFCFVRREQSLGAAMTKEEKPRTELFYGSHQDVFDRNDPDQDLLWKFSIPVSERTKALQDLGRMNINAFSLFGSEDSLCEELAMREFVLGEK